MAFLEAWRLRLHGRGEVLEPLQLGILVLLNFLLNLRVLQERAIGRRHTEALPSGEIVLEVVGFSALSVKRQLSELGALVVVFVGLEATVVSHPLFLESQESGGVGGKASIELIE